MKGPLVSPDPVTSRMRGSHSIRCPGRCTFVSSNFNREHNQIVVAGRNRIERQSFHDWNTLAEQNSMGHWGRRAELFCREVVYAHQSDASIGQQLGSVRRDVSEVVMKDRGRHPTA